MPWQERSADTILIFTFRFLSLHIIQENNWSQVLVFTRTKFGANNVADYLVRDPEISFKRKAAMGDSSDIISIRGMESKRIMLNLDGRNISSTGMSGGNYIDFGTIPLDNIEKIEVIKGGSSRRTRDNSSSGTSRISSSCTCRIRRAL